MHPAFKPSISSAGGQSTIVAGRGQGVLVHVDVGTANAANAMHNMLRTRIPVLLMAGKAPFTAANELIGTRDTYVHVIQEPFDQASLVRPYVKWEWTLPSGVVAKEALQRAHSIMHAEPQGPVYLMMHRETLTQELRADIRSYGVAQRDALPRSVADPAHVSRLAEKLLTAQTPILITAYGGRNPNTSKAIEALAEFAGIPVFEPTPVNNISREGPCFMGFSPDRHVRYRGCRSARRRRRALVPVVCRAERFDLLGTDRCRCAQDSFADVGLSRQSEAAGRQRTHS
jgi:acetolactate synthase-1/2/3 large subunit